MNEVQQLRAENRMLRSEVLIGIGRIAGGGVLISTSSMAVGLVSGVHVMHPFFAVSVLAVSVGFWWLTLLIRLHNKRSKENL